MFFIADISVIGISVNLLIGAPLVMMIGFSFKQLKNAQITLMSDQNHLFGQCVLLQHILLLISSTEYTMQKYNVIVHIYIY